MTKNEIIQLLSKKNITSFNLGLIGGLGAGKTFFVKELLKQIAPDLSDEVSSPSFNICNRYINKVLKVHHFDLYRIESEKELEEIELYESLDEPVVTIIEWVNQFPELEKFCDLTIKIGVGNDEIRDYQIQ